jgi:hypothetical protein
MAVRLSVKTSIKTWDRRDKRWRQHHDSDRCTAVFIISFVSTLLLSLRHVAYIMSWLFFLWGGTKSLSTAATSCLLYKPHDRWGWLWSNWWNKDWQGKPKYSEKKCLSATLSTTNPTWPDPDSNPGCRCGKPATNRLSYDAASLDCYMSWRKPVCGLPYSPATLHPQQDSWYSFLLEAESTPGP